MSGWNSSHTEASTRLSKVTRQGLRAENSWRRRVLASHLIISNPCPVLYSSRAVMVLVFTKNPHKFSWDSFIFMSHWLIDWIVCMFVCLFVRSTFHSISRNFKSDSLIFTFASFIVGSDSSDSFLLKFFFFYPWIIFYYTFFPPLAREI